MKKSSLLLAATLAVGCMGAGAYGEELYTPESYLDHWGPSKSRAQVKQETLRALAAGEVAFGEVDRPLLASTPVSDRSRAEVKAETLQALAAHEVRFGDVDARPIASNTSVFTRRQVREELLATRKMPSHAVLAN